MAKDPDLWKLNRTRVFLIIMLVIALALSVTTIVGSLNGWQGEDAGTVAPQAGP